MVDIKVFKEARKQQIRGETNELLEDVRPSYFHETIAEKLATLATVKATSRLDRMLSDPPTQACSDIGSTRLSYTSSGILFSSNHDVRVIHAPGT